MKTDLTKIYRFRNGMIASQEECTLDQDKQLLKLFSEMELGDSSFDLSKLTFEKLVRIVTEQGAVEKFLEIVLRMEIETGSTDFGSLHRSEVAEVIKDFFELSPVLKICLGTGRFAQALLSAFVLRTKASTQSSSATTTDSEDTSKEELPDTSEEQTKNS